MMESSADTQLIQEQGTGEPATFDRCRRCHRRFKAPKKIPYGSKCAKIIEARMNAVKKEAI